MRASSLKAPESAAGWKVLTILWPKYQYLQAFLEAWPDEFGHTKF